MENNEKKYNVKNRSAGMVVYSVPEMNIRREFAVGESKVIPGAELEALTYQAGGTELLVNYLQIQNSEETAKLNIRTEKEYWMSEQEIAELMKTGTIDEFLDALDFAPAGVIDIIKQLSTTLPLTDTNKINALKEKTGFDVLSAMRNEQMLNEDTAPQATVSERRVKEEKPASQERRVSEGQSNYKIVG